MSLSVGDRLPEATFKTPTADGPKAVTTADVFAGKKVVLFAVPGAFTPTCSDAHLPGFQVRAPEILAAGADAIACLAVNDVFVLGAWAKARTIGPEITLLGDGNGDFVRAAGLELNLSGFGMGVRSSRFAAIIDDGVVMLLNVEPGGEVGVSSAETVLAALKG